MKRVLRDWPQVKTKTGWTVRFSVVRMCVLSHYALICVDACGAITPMPQASGGWTTANTFRSLYGCNRSMCFLSIVLSVVFAIY